MGSYRGSWRGGCRGWARLDRCSRGVGPWRPETWPSPPRRVDQERTGLAHARRAILGCERPGDALVTVERELAGEAQAPKSVVECLSVELGQRIPEVGQFHEVR